MPKDDLPEGAEGQQDDAPEVPETPDQQTSTEPPEWDYVLQAVPESLHPILRPEIERYAAEQRTKYDELNSQYEAWKPLTEDEIDAEQALKAVEFARSLQESPVEVYQRLRDFLIENQLLQEEGQTEEPAAPETPPVPATPVLDDADIDDPAYLKLKQVFEAQSSELAGLKEVVTTLTENWQQAQTQTQKQQQQAELEAYLESLKEHGDYDRDFVLTRIAKGIDGAAAVKEWQDKVQAAAKAVTQPEADAPPVVGGGGVLPSNRVSVGKLSSEETKQLVADMARKAAEAAN